MSEAEIRQLVTYNVDYVRKNYDAIYLRNFDKNFSSMQTKCVSASTVPASSLCIGNGSILLGTYDFENNRMYLYPENLNRVKIVYNDKDNKLAGRLVFHEMLHMISSDRELGVSGVNNKEESHVALNEGITEFFAFSAYRDTNLLHSSYVYETLLVVQLAVIVGTKYISLSYFNYHNITTLKVLLSRYVSEEKADEFFTLLEQFYEDRTTKGDFSLLGKLQLILSDAFKAKCNMFNISPDTVNYYKNYLISNDLVNKSTGRELNIPLLKESIDVVDSINVKRSK